MDIVHSHRSFLVFLFPVSTDTAQLYNTQSDLCMRTPHLDRIGLWSSIRLAIETIATMTSHMVVDTSHDSWAVSERSSEKLQVHRDHKSTKD